MLGLLILKDEKFVEGYQWGEFWSRKKAINNKKILKKESSKYKNY